MTNESEKTDLISEKDYARFLKEYNKLIRIRSEQNEMKNTELDKYNLGKDKLDELKELIERKKRQRLEMSDAELFVLRKQRKSL